MFSIIEFEYKTVQNENFSGDGEEFKKVSRAVGKKTEIIYTRTIQWRLAKPVKIFPGNIVLPRPIDPRQMGLLKGAGRRVKEGTSAVLLQLGLDEKWWAESRECYCYLRNVTDLLSDGKTPCEKRFGEPFKRPVNSVWFDAKVIAYPETSIQHFSHLFCVVLCANPTACVFDYTLESPLMVMRRELLAGQNADARSAHG